MEFDIRPGYDAPEEIAALFKEYTDALVAEEPEFRRYLDLQGYDAEAEHPEDKYSMPGGRLYLARAEGKPVGCVALRQIDEKRCEIKRLYVRPAYRERGLGGQLIQRLISDARAIGYECLLLDTLPFLTDAIGMYHRRGFVDIPSYNNSPMENLVYMRLDLKKCSLFVEGSSHQETALNSQL